MLDTACPYVLIDAELMKANGLFPAAPATLKRIPQPIGLGGTTFVVTAQTRVRHTITTEASDGQTVQASIHGINALFVQGLAHWTSSCKATGGPV